MSNQTALICKECQEPIESESDLAILLKWMDSDYLHRNCYFAWASKLHPLNMRIALLSTQQLKKQAQAMKILFGFLLALAAFLMFILSSEGLVILLIPIPIIPLALLAQYRFTKIDEEIGLISRIYS